MKYIQLASAFSGAPSFVSVYEIAAIGEELTPTGVQNCVVLRNGGRLAVRESPIEIRALMPDISVFSIKDRLVAAETVSTDGEVEG